MALSLSNLLHVLGGKLLMKFLRFLESHLTHHILLQFVLINYVAACKDILHAIES